MAWKFFTSSGQEKTVLAAHPGFYVVDDTLVGVSTASLTINLPTSTYSHIEMLIQARGVVAAVTDDLRFRFNGDTGANYDYGRLYGSSSTATNVESFGQTSGLIGSFAAASATANVAGMHKIWIPNYRNTTFNKQLHSTGGRKYGTAAGNLQQEVNNSQWRNTAAVTSITLFFTSGNIDAGSRVTTYAFGTTN